MKTTYLFKCHGAWSPLWQLSNEKWFAITSHDYEANMYVSCDLGNDHVNAVFTQILETMENAIHMGCSTKEMAYKHTMYGACVLEPKPYQQTACEKLTTKYDLDLQIQSRAYEIFGCDNSGVKKRLVWMRMLETGPVMVQKCGDETTVTPLN